MNVLMIMADQLPAAALGAYGHPVVKTPNIDRLAAQGTCFENCYCNNPLCVPSRASMMSGRLTSRIGCYDNGSELPASVPTFAHCLRAGGYRTVLCGKMHFIGPDQLHGFEERLTTDIYPSGFNWTPDWRRGVYANPGTSVVQLKDTGQCRWNLQLDYDEEVHFRARERLRGLAREADRRPFFLCVSYTHPHDPYVTTPAYWERYRDDEIDLPAAGARPMDQMHPVDQWLQVHHEVDTHPPSEADVLRTRHAFYGMVSCFDDKVGGVLAELDRLGMADDTAVLLCSDHGEMMGEYGMWFKRTCREWSSHVPLIVRKPGAAEGRRVCAAVSLVDLFPTLLDMADLPAADTPLDGHSLAPSLDYGAAPRDAAIIEYLGEGVIQPVRAVRRGRYKYVYVHGFSSLLFDVEADPCEERNLAGMPEHAAVEADLHDAVLRGWDPEATRAAVMQSQQERLLLRGALAEGQRWSWDFQPRFDAAKQYVREQDAQATNVTETLR